MELKIHIISWTHGITEQLKAEYAFEWIGRMNNIQVCAMEIVNEEIVYTYNRQAAEDKSSVALRLQKQLPLDFQSFSEYNSNVTNSNIRRMYNG